MAYLTIYKKYEFVLKKKKPVARLIIPPSSLSTSSFAHFADRHQFGKVNLATGNVSKFSYPSFIRGHIVCICALHEGEDKNFCVIGLLNSGELFLYNAEMKSLYIIQGPSNLIIPEEYKPEVQTMSGFQRLRSFGKDFFSKSESSPIEVIEASTREKESEEEEICFTFRPKIFASSDLTKVFLVGNYRKICLWQRTFRMNSLESKANFSGLWKVFSAPDNQPFPSKMNKAKLNEISFIAKGSTGPLCHIYFGFMTDDLIVLSTMVVRWNVMTASTWMDPTSTWKQIKIPLKDIEAKNNIFNRRGALVARASHESSLLVLCLNTSATMFYLLYVTPESQFTSVVSSLYPSVSRGMDSRSHWVVALDWAENDSFVIGCLKSGHVFISSRMGNLLQINCKDLPLLSEPTNFLPLLEDFSEKGFRGNDLSESSNETSVTSKPKFSILPNVSEGVFLIFSGFRGFLFSFPKDLRSGKEVLSFLLKRCHLANHELQRLCGEHHYDYIHCSSWRLARSLLNLNQIDKSEDPQVKNSLQLWLPGSLSDQNTAASFPLTDLETQMTETFTFILSSWAFLSSASNLSRNHKRSLTEAAISETLKLLETILVASPVAGDHEEHQVRLIQTLRLLHQIIKTVELKVYPMHMIKPTLQLTRRYFRLVLSAKQSPEMKLAYILVLTQTLISMEHTLDQRSLFISHRTKKLWFYLFRNTTPLWKQAQLTYSNNFHLKLRSVTGIIQRRVLHLQEFRTLRIDREFKTLLGGNLKSGFQKLMQEIVKILKGTFSKRKLKRYISYGFYSLVINNDFRTLVEFVCWCVDQLREFQESTKAEKDGKLEGKLEAILRNILGNLGILMAKSLLASSASLQEPFLRNSCSIPPEFSEDLRGIQLEETTSITLPLTIFCLIIGGNWDSVHYLAYAMGDIKLSLFSALLSNQNGRSRVEDVVEASISSYLRPDYLSYEFSDYKTIQDLLQVASMLEVEILSPIVDKCVERIEELLLELPFSVHEDFKLPSPPWFCPQFEIDEVDCESKEDWIEEPYSCHKEVLIRRESSILIYFFTVLVSASGLTSLFIDDELDELKKSTTEEFEFVLNYSSRRLKRVDKKKLQSSSVYKGLLSTWKKLLEIVRWLRLRDRVSVQLREWSFFKVNITQVSTLQEKSSDLLKLCYEAFMFKNHSWRNDLLRIILTVAFDAPPTADMGAIVALVVSHIKPIPSLMKQKLDYLLEFWKRIKLKTNEYSDGKEAPSLFEYFENQFGKHFNSDSVAWLKFEDFEDKLEEFVSFVSMTLLKLDESFASTEIPFPFLCQFGSQIRKLESSCLRLVTDLIEYPIYRHDDNISVIATPTLNSTFTLDSQISRKKGFFKNSKPYTGNLDKLGTAIFYAGDSSIRPTERRPRRHLNPFLVDKKRTPKKRSSISLISSGEGPIRQEVNLKSVFLAVNGSPQGNEISNLITRIFFSEPSLTRDYTLPGPLSNALLWIADEKRRFRPTTSLTTLKKETELEPLLSENELRQALKWASWNRGSKQVSPLESWSNGSTNTNRGSNLSNPFYHDLKKENLKQSPAIDVLIASALSKAKTKKTLLTKITAAVGAEDKNYLTPKTSQKQEMKEFFEVDNSGMDSNKQQLDANLSDAVQIQNQDPKLNNEIENHPKEDNSIRSGTSPTKDVVKLLESNSGFWKYEETSKVSQLQHELNPWKPFSSLSVNNHAPGDSVAVSISKTEIASGPSGAEVNCPQLQVFESESSSGSSRSDHSYDATSQNFNDNTLDDVTLSKSLQASNIEGPGNANMLHATPNSEIVVTINKKRHENGDRKEKKMDIKNNYLREMNIKERSPLVFLKIPKLEKKIQSEPPKWILKEIPPKPPVISNELKCASAIKFLKVPLFGKEGLTPKEANIIHRLLEPAKVLGSDPTKPKKASLKLDHKIQTDAFCNRSISRGVQFSDGKSEQKDKSIQASEINLEAGVGKEPIKFLSSKHVQTCALMEREALERSYLKDLPLENKKKLEKYNLVHNIDSYLEVKSHPLGSTSDLKDLERLKDIIKDPVKDSSTETGENMTTPRATTMQENIQEKGVTSYSEENADVSHYYIATAGQFGARRVAVDLYHPIVDIFQEPGQNSHIIDIPESIVKKQLDKLEGDLNQPVTKTMERNSLFSSHQIIDFKSVDDNESFRSQKVSNMLQKTTNDIINMFMVGDISANNVCEFLKTSQLETSKAPTDSKGEVSKEPSPQDSKRPPIKERLRNLIQEVTMTHDDFYDTKSLLSKVDVVIDSVIQQEALQWDDRIRMAKVEALRSNDDSLKRRQNQNNDVESYIEQISLRNLDRQLEDIYNYNTETQTTIRSTQNTRLLENKDTSENNLQYSVVVDNHDRFQRSPLLHLDLTCFRSEESPTSPPKTDGSSPKTLRREEIRAWMKRKRLQRRKSPKKTERAEGNEATAKPSLTGRQIREINKRSKKQRILRTEEHSRKRINDIENLFRHFNDEKETILGRGLKSISVAQERLMEVEASSPSDLLLNATQQKPKNQKLNHANNVSVADVELEVGRLRQLLSLDKVRNPAERFLAKASIKHEKTRLRKANLTLARSPYHLDRISEIDSENSNATTPAASIVTKDTLSSTDSSWNMPADIKNILGCN